MVKSSTNTMVRSIWAGTSGKFHRVVFFELLFKLLSVT